MVWAHKKINRTCKDDPTSHGTAQGGRRKGRQKKRWEDNIPEWTGLGLRTERKGEKWLPDILDAPTVIPTTG